MLGYTSLDTCKKIMEPHFQKALESRESTVWVCLQQVVSPAAGEFLQRRGIRVPDEISLMGINDNEYSCLQGITVFDFQKDNIGYLAAHYLLGDIPAHKNRQGVIDTPGRILVRKSVKALNRGFEEHWNSKPVYGD